MPNIKDLARSMAAGKMTSAGGPAELSKAPEQEGADLGEQPSGIEEGLSMVESALADLPEEAQAEAQSHIDAIRGLAGGGELPAEEPTGVSEGQPELPTA